MSNGHDHSRNTIPALEYVTCIICTVFDNSITVLHCRKSYYILLTINFCNFTIASCIKHPVLSCPLLSCLVLPCLVLPCVVLSCPLLSCLVFSCLVLPCLVLPCVVLFQSNSYIICQCPRIRSQWLSFNALEGIPNIHI